MTTTSTGIDARLLRRALGLVAVAALVMWTAWVVLLGGAEPDRGEFCADVGFAVASPELTPVAAAATVTGLDGWEVTDGAGAPGTVTVVRDAAAGELWRVDVRGGGSAWRAEGGCVEE